MIKIGKYYIGEERLKKVVEEGRPLAEAYPNLPSDILAQLQEVVTSRLVRNKKKANILAKLQEEAKRLLLRIQIKRNNLKKKLNHD